MKLIVGISGASGAVYGARLLEVLRDCADVQTHLVVSDAAKQILPVEPPYWAFDRLSSLADFVYDVHDLSARIASGSFLYDGTVVAPCSARTLAAVALGYGDNLLTRACDVTLKERHRLVLLFRETPLHLAHIRNMERVTEMGAIVLPPVPAFYHQPRTIEDLVDHTVGKVLDLFAIEHQLFKRWGGPEDTQ